MLMKKLIQNGRINFVRGLQTQRSLPIPYKAEYCNGYLIDDRIGHRELIEETIEMHDTIRFEIPDRQDIAMIGQFITDLYNKSCSMFSCLNPTFDDTAPFVFNILDHVLDKGTSVVAFDGDKLVGFSMNTFYDHHELPEVYPLGVFHDNPRFEIQNDYGKDIDNGPFSTRKSNQIQALCSASYAQTGKFLPKDIKNLGISEAVGVHPQYFRLKLLLRMMKVSENISRQKGCNYFGGYCAAVSSYEYCKKRGFKTLYVLPYDQFKEHGEVVFKNLPDNAYGIYAQLLKL